MKKKDFITLFAITTLLLVLSVACLYVVTTLTDVSDTYKSTAEHSKTIIDKIKSGNQPLTDAQVITLFSNDIKEGNSIRSLLNSYKEMMEAFAWLVITLAIFQGYIIISRYYKK